MAKKTSNVKFMLGTIVIILAVFLLVTQFVKIGSLFSPTQLEEEKEKVKGISSQIVTLQKKEGKNITWEIKSSAFGEGDFIPKKFTADGENISPPLFWGLPPEGTKSIALIMEDPDAPIGIFTHWIIYDIPPDIRELPANIPKERVLESIGGAKQGKNDFGKIGYGGPSPPPGRPHRYIFRIYALKEKLQLPAGVRRKEFLEAVKDKEIEVAELMGKYGR